MQITKDFENIYLKYSDKIYKYLYLNTLDPYLSEDITSEVFLRVWKNWEKIKFDYIQAFLYKIAKNIMIDHFRKNKNNKKTSLEEMVEMGIEPHYDEDLIERIEKDDNIQRIKNALKLLPENLREVVILRFINDMSAKDAADIMNTSEVNIRVLQYRALGKLREVIEDEQ
jgi:RNA polymerase sigma-70 factor, ECF subfamily